jgi:hypothetical protein
MVADYLRKFDAEAAARRPVTCGGGGGGKLHGADFDGFLRKSCVAHSGAARAGALAS